MKKFTLLLLTVIISIALTMTFMACNDQGGTDSGVDTNNSDTSTAISATLIFVDESGNIIFEKTTETSANYLSEFVAEITSNSSNSVTCEASESSNGLYMDTFTVNGTMYPKEVGAFVIMYTSLTDSEYIYAGYETTINDVTYNSCGLGMSSMPIKDGVTYVIVSEIIYY